jgi:predicted transcriptional regulator
VPNAAQAGVLSTIWRSELDAAAGDHMLYHMVMARKEVLVQLDEELVRRLDALAAQVGTSRSELLRRGALAVLEAEELAAADRRLAEAYRAQPQDPAIVAAAARLAGETAPPW